MFLRDRLHVWMNDPATQKSGCGRMNFLPTQGRQSPELPRRRARLSSFYPILRFVSCHWGLFLVSRDTFDTSLCSAFEKDAGSGRIFWVYRKTYLRWLTITELHRVAMEMSCRIAPAKGTFRILQPFFPSLVSTCTQHQRMNISSSVWIEKMVCTYSAGTDAHTEQVREKNTLSTMCCHQSGATYTESFTNTFTS